MNQASLFKREPVTIDGYVPKFTRAECLLGYACQQVKQRDWNLFGDEDYASREERFTFYYSLTILDKKFDLDSREYPYAGNVFDHVAELCNKFTAYHENKKNHPDQYAYLTDNAKELNNSKRYWQAMMHRAEIQKVRTEIERLKAQLERAGYVASINAVGVLEERTLSHDERLQLWADFSGGLPFTRD